MSIDLHEGMNDIEIQQHGPEVGVSSQAYSSLTPSGIDYSAPGAPTVAEGYFGRAGESEPPAAAEDDFDDVEAWDDEATFTAPDGTMFTADEWTEREESLRALHEHWSRMQDGRQLLELSQQPGGEDYIRAIQDRQALAADVAQQLEPLLAPLHRAEQEQQHQARVDEAEEQAYGLIEEIAGPMDEAHMGAARAAADWLYAQPEWREEFPSDRDAAEAAIEHVARLTAEQWALTQPPSPVRWDVDRAGEPIPRVAKMDTRGFDWYRAQTEGRPTSVAARWLQEGRF